MRTAAIDVVWFARISAAICLSLPYATIANAQADPPSDAAPHLIFPLSSTLAVVYGDPSKPGAPFVLRLTNRANQIVPVHWHPEDENITVIQGTWYLGSGDKFDRKALREMNVGDYAWMPKKMRHFGWAKTDIILQ